MKIKKSSTKELRSICKKESDSVLEKIERAKRILSDDPDSSDNLLAVVVGKPVPLEEEEKRE